MVYVRSMKLKTGTFHYVIPNRHARPLPCGSGREALEYAQELAAEIRKANRDARCGKIVPPLCVWTLADAKAADLEEARRRGLRTIQPQFEGKVSRRESHWNNLTAFFGEKTNLDEITAARIRAYITRREGEGLGPASTNRDLDVLRTALAIARDRQESGLRGDPFKGVPRLEEASRRRAPIALPEANLDRVIRACWRRNAKLGAYVELLRLTASRLRETPTRHGKLLIYPAYKRGLPRTFHIEGRLAEVLKLPRRFDRRIWVSVVNGKEGRPGACPGLRPHDIRHSVLTILGGRPETSLLELQKWGGWKRPETAAIYLHPDASALRPLGSRMR